MILTHKVEAKNHSMWIFNAQLTMDYPAYTMPFDNIDNSLKLQFMFVAQYLGRVKIMVIFVGYSFLDLGHLVAEKFNEAIQQQRHFIYKICGAALISFYAL